MQSYKSVERLSLFQDSVSSVLVVYIPFQPRLVLHTHYSRTADPLAIAVQRGSHLLLLLLPYFLIDRSEVAPEYPSTAVIREVGDQWTFAVYTNLCLCPCRIRSSRNEDASDALRVATRKPSLFWVSSPSCPSSAWTSQFCALCATISCPTSTSSCCKARDRSVNGLGQRSGAMHTTRARRAHAPFSPRLLAGTTVVIARLSAQLQRYD